MFKINFMKFLFIFFTLPFYGQILHHQMISSQGDTKKLSNGIIVKQTVGQQSIIGSSKNDYVITQGFQQSFWNRYIATNYYSNIVANTFPNPFIDRVSFEFSDPIDEVVNIYIYNISGNLVFEKAQKPTDKILSFDLKLITGRQFLVRIQSTNFVYYTKIIKQ